jgi:hypothetical protein
MKINWKESLQIVSNMAILFGIILVILELQQTQTLVRAQLSSDSYSAMLDHSNTMMGESPEIVYAKACFRPEDLTPQDAFIMTEILGAKGRLAMRGKDIEEIAELNIDWVSPARAYFQQASETEFGRRMFPVVVGFFDNDLKEIANEVMAESEGVDCAQRYEYLLQRQLD